VLHSGSLLLPLCNIVLEAVFKLGIALRRWIIFEMINGASCRINFPVGDSSIAFFALDIKEEIAVCG
jgi:hypothetical protein